MDISLPATKVIEAETPKKVIVYRKELLRLSETFIKAQVGSYQRWQAVLFGERIWPGGLSLDGIGSRTLMDARPTLVKRIVAKARQTARLAPAFVITERPRRIVFVGRLVEVKGCAYLIEAFQEIARCIPNAELVVMCGSLSPGSILHA